MSAVLNPKPAFAVCDGNEAAALAVSLSNVDMVAIYPITPQSSLVEYLAKYAADGKRCEPAFKRREDNRYDTTEKAQGSERDMGDANHIAWAESCGRRVSTDALKRRWARFRGGLQRVFEFGH